ncbi:hypothetical protein DYBT9623_05350 [Dyadobacter sp. CECT 9623]|uniref:Lipoprotein n=1 Tax=Dyadobacter linearis TaxID=2823330 RepID=A0ABM8UYB7_9BACT|nr:hypothetical protein [Dyadobacter sp. CECT 9623]CAG5074663.1 hypothetical protein DYBT9623_05350 [Dyadobacter sp. CECT 9623]
MRKIVFFVLAISLLSASCQRRTHIFGFVGDENKKAIIGAKMAVVKVSGKYPSKADTLAIGYSKENGYQLNLVKQGRHKNVQLVNPYLINADLQDKFRISEVSKGGKAIPDSDCCEIIIGVANEHSFLLKK